MKPHLPFSAALLILSSILPTGSMAGETLKELKPGQRLEVWFECRGCFSKEKYFFVFDGRCVSISLVTEDAKGNLVKNPMGELMLTAKETESLDQMFERYRNAASGGINLTESLSVEVWETNKRISKELLVDGNPNHMGRAEGEIRLWDLIGRTREAE